MKIVLNLILSVAAGFSISFGAIATTTFEAGKDYQIVSAKVETEPMVEEFFNYACAHCYTMEKFISDFKANNPNIKVQPVPMELRPAWAIYVKAYYIGEKLEILDKSHNKIFHMIHVDKKHFKNDADMKSFFLSLGVEEKQYDEVAKSYWLNTKVRMAKQYAMKNKVMSTPTLLVNKRFKLDNGEIGSYEKLAEAMIELSGVKHTETSNQ